MQCRQKSLTWSIRRYWQSTPPRLGGKVDGREFRWRRFKHHHVVLRHLIDETQNLSVTIVLGDHTMITILTAAVRTRNALVAISLLCTTARKSSNFCAVLSSRHILRQIGMIETPLHLRCRKVRLTDGAEEKVTRRPESPVDFAPWSQLLVEIRHVVRETPIDIAHMRRHHLSPAIQFHVLRQAMHITRYRLSHTFATFHATKEARKRSEMSSNRLSFTLTKALYELAKESRLNAILLILDTFEFKIGEHCREPRYDRIVETAQIRRDLDNFGEICMTEGQALVEQWFHLQETRWHENRYHIGGVEFRPILLRHECLALHPIDEPIEDF